MSKLKEQCKDMMVVMMVNNTDSDVWQILLSPLEVLHKENDKLNSSQIEDQRVP